MAVAVSGAVSAAQIAVRVRRAPTLRARPSLLTRSEDLTTVCTLISDCHVVAEAHTPCELEVDPGQWPWRDVPTSADMTRGLRHVLEDVVRRAPRTVVWCGDEVDTGDASEWKQWRAVVDAVPGLTHRLVPGNHDICFNRPFDEDYALTRRALRERAYQDHAGRLADFPVVDTMITDAGAVTVVLLDSCRNRSTHLLSNAVGHFGEEQLEELARLLAQVHGPLLCIAHHHVWRDESFLQPEAWYNTAVDADELVSILTSYRRTDPRNQVLVCHGHRHALTAGEVGDLDAPIAVVGLPSTTLGDKSTNGMLDGILRYGIAGLRRDGTWAVALHEVGALVQAGERSGARPATPPSRALIALSGLGSAPIAAPILHPDDVLAIVKT
ncbi:MAG: metallophosphoesterase [Kofleriaceae bacterium]